MPSPFPGMDPYLEDTLWTTVQVSLSADIAPSLSGAAGGTLCNGDPREGCHHDFHFLCDE